MGLALDETLSFCAADEIAGIGPHFQPKMEGDYQPHTQPYQGTNTYHFTPPDDPKECVCSPFIPFCYCGAKRFLKNLWK